MLTLGSLGFAAPWALSALGLLPLLWVLLRLTPPAPVQVIFPPLRLLMGLRAPEETSARTPLWLLLLRLTLITALILAAARPVLDAGHLLRGQGPVVLVVDNGWAAARDWAARRAFLERLVAEAARQERPVALIPTARRDAGTPHLELLDPDTARDRVRSLVPKPWGTDRATAMAVLADLPDGPPGHGIWIADGLDGGHAYETAAALRRLGAVGFAAAEGVSALVLRSPENTGKTLEVPVERANAKGMREEWIRAFSADGQLLTRERVTFADGARHAKARLALPLEMRNRLARLDIEGEETAGAVILVDERWRRRPVGLVVPEDAGGGPLLSAGHYLRRALEPFTEVRRGSVGDLLKRELAVMVLADPEPMTETETKRLGEWVEAGGLVLHFAGPRLARGVGKKSGLFPVRLRFGARAMGGALSWRKPAKLAPFSKGSPFHGLAVPGDVTVRRQVLAEPAPDLNERTWARLGDGTPLVTADRRGDGWIVLVHTAADPSWSSLPLSGLFVQMLRRVLDLPRGVVSHAGGPPLKAVQLLDGFGRLGVPVAGGRAILAEVFGRTPAGPATPPGLYGEGKTLRALNLGPSIPKLEKISALPPGVEHLGLSKAEEQDLRSWLLAVALTLALMDMAASLALRGLLRRGWVAGAVLILLVPTASADDAAFVAATRDTRLAYVLTGNDRIDETSRAGLFGLGVVVNRRTAVHLAEPVGIDPESDELAFYPLLYWPLGEDMISLTEAGAAKVRSYLRNGGLILFDSRGTAEAGGDALANLADELGIPPLIPLPDGHVLRRSYYLLRQVSGRWAERPVWVERSGERVNDGVSPVVAGDLDWGGAWAVDDGLRPLFPVVPGGERQREMAYRFGVNLVMYALTGNYKADQVHLPTILKRLRQ